jgi:hypothetical protein
LVDEPVTVTVAYQVSPGREEQFSDWATSMLREAAHYVEYLGGGILGPGGTGDDWHVVFRWSNQEAAQLWEASPARTRLAAKVSGFAQVQQAKRTTGVRAWFDLSSRIAASPPPKWKAALVTLAAVFPPVLLFNLTVIPYLGGLSVVLRTLTLCVAVTGVVTWVMMPRLQRLLKNWLSPPPAAEGVDVGAPEPAEAGRAIGIGRRQRRGWSGGGDGGEDFTYGGGGATYAGGGGTTYGGGATYATGRAAARDAGYGEAAEPAWLVEVAPRGREEDPGWRDDGWRDVKPGRGPWYSSQRAEQDPEPAASYRQRAESAPTGGYRQRAESEPTGGYRQQAEPEPTASYRQRAAAPSYRDRADAGDAEETQVWYREQQDSGSWYREEPAGEPEPRYRDREPHPDGRYWEEQQRGTWYREREPDTGTQPARREGDYEQDDGTYYDTRRRPRYASQQQGRPDDEEYDEPDWQPDREPGTGRYRR